jgi:hypothetical protein
MATTRIWRPVIGAIAILAACPIGAINAAPRDLTVETGQIEAPFDKTMRPFNVSLIPTMPSVLTIGSRFGFRLKSTADGFGHLYALSASGKVQLWFENVPVRRMHTVSYPSSGLELRAAPPAGDETIIFVVTRDRLDGFAGRGTTRSPLALQYAQGAFNDALAQKTSTIERTQWASVSSMIRVSEQVP